MEWLFIGLAVLYLLVKLAGGSDRRAPSPELTSNLGSLDVHTARDYLDLENGGQLELLKTTVGGNLLVPYAGAECRLIYTIIDVTDPDEYLPVVCYLEEFTDGQSPIFYVEAKINVSFQLSSIENMKMPPVPPVALFLGRRGQRRLKLSVRIVGPDDKIYGYGETFVTQTQSDYGFLEQGERNAKTDRAIAALGLSICASDGHIDKRETETIKRYFSEHFAGLDEDVVQERKDQLNEAMRELMAHAKEVVAKMSQEEVEAEIRSRAAAIAEFGSDPLNHAAYQLVAQIVAADEQVEESELAMVKVVAEVLEIPDELDREMRDRYFKLAMFEHEDHSAVLNMPGELTRDEKKEFLNREYEKWRRRATHSDPKVREEANARLEAVTKARRELEDG